MSKKIRVLHYCNQLGIGGTERTMEIFCRTLDREKFEVYCASRFFELPLIDNLRLNLGSFVGHSKSSSKLRSYGQMNSRVSHFKKMLGPNLILLKNNEELHKLVKEKNIDILHAHTSGRAEFPTDQTSIMSEFKAVVTTNQFELQNTSEAEKYIKKFLFVSQWLLKNKAHWAHGDARAGVLYNPIELPLTQENLRAELGIPADAFVLGRVGRADPGIHDPISLLAYQKCQNQKTYFLALSAPMNMVEEASRLKLQNFIPLKGTSDALYLSKFYNTIDVLAHARKDGETFGLNLAEAMMHGKPVVSHLTPFMNAQVEIIGEGGAVVAQDDVQAYAENLKKYRDHESERTAAGAKAKKHALENFEAKMLTKKLEAIYLGVL